MASQSPFTSPQTASLEAPKYHVRTTPDAEGPEVVPADHAFQIRKPSPIPSPAPGAAEKEHYVPPASNGGRKTICGLAPAVFILSVILAVVVVIAAVGGGVGGSMAVKSARSEALAEGLASCSTVSSTTTTPDSPSATASTTESPSIPTEEPYIPPTNVVLALDCPSLTNETVPMKFMSNDYEFESECGVDLVALTSESPQINIIGVVSYSLNHCMRACLAYNRYGDDDRCTGITFLANLDAILDSNTGNCYLKRGTGRLVEYEPSDQRDLIISARLVEED